MLESVFKVGVADCAQNVTKLLDHSQGENGGTLKEAFNQLGVPPSTLTFYVCQ